MKRLTLSTFALSLTVNALTYTDIPVRMMHVFWIHILVMVCFVAANLDAIKHCPEGNKKILDYIEIPLRPKITIIAFIALCVISIWSAEKFGQFGCERGTWEYDSIESVYKCAKSEGGYYARQYSVSEYKNINKTSVRYFSSFWCLLTSVSCFIYGYVIPRLKAIR